MFFWAQFIPSGNSWKKKISEFAKWNMDSIFQSSDLLPSFQLILINICEGERAKTVLSLKTERARQGGSLCSFSPSVNVHPITSIAVIYITPKSKQLLKWGFGGTKIRFGVRQKIFSAGEKPCIVCVVFVNMVVFLFFFDGLILWFRVRDRRCSSAPPCPRRSRTSPKVLWSNPSPSTWAEPGLPAWTSFR